MRIPRFQNKMLIGLMVFTLFSISSIAKELLLLTDDGPPHMIAATNNGIDVDITREILEELGYRVKVEFAPLKRSLRQVIQKKADIFLPAFYQEDTSELFFSTPIITYRPIAFSLKSSNFIFKNIPDLAKTNLVTFQGATGYFGEEFVEVSKFNGYRELHDMSKFPEMLIKGRCDVVVLDYYIFHYFLQAYLKQSSTDKYIIDEINEFSLFPEVNAHVAFNDKKLRNIFNEKLSLYKRQNKEQAVIDKYIGTGDLPL